MTDLMRTSRPPMKRFLLFQSDNFFRTQSINSCQKDMRRGFLQWKGPNKQKETCQFYDSSQAYQFYDSSQWLLPPTSILVCLK